MAFLNLIYVSKIVSFLILLHKGNAEITIDDIYPVIPPNFTQTAHSLGMPCEEFQVTTEDGYILDMFHIAGDPKRPSLVVSGDFGTCDDYMNIGNVSLPYVLWKAGYDTWMGNFRGCRYGRRHVCLDPDTDDEFWDFSFHEWGVYDLPAMVDFVLNKTKAPSLSSISWSYGTAANFIMGVVRPEYNQKVNVIIALAPIAYLDHSVPFDMIAPLSAISGVSLNLMDENEVLGEKSIAAALLRKTCSTPEVAHGLCLSAACLVLGSDLEQILPEVAPKIFQHFPSSTSSKNVLHQVQNGESNRFCYFDYGPEENIKRYGSILPKEYDMSKNNISIVLISGKNDQTSKIADVEHLKPKIVNLDEYIILEPEKFNHLDFVAGKDTHKVLYEPIVLEKLKKYNNVC